ncbi:MAG: hypothetical protein LPD71_10635 [Shewanella sp.]|nr:hypothetical protein [Shewanella sp.]MCF1429360.1 hypothetical protein [Shewanella sp.]MCF1439173.1 hypothetical protein [Shewanella sp.]MCF1456068.1 hypothetical protein [Shewanella sp.]
MLIELVHMSADTVTEVMDIVDGRQYSGVITSHSWMNSAKDGGLHRNTLRRHWWMALLAPYNANVNQLAGSINRYQDIIAANP